MYSIFFVIKRHKRLKFENYLSSIKLKIKSGYLPLHQFYNRLSEGNSLEPSQIPKFKPQLKGHLGDGYFKTVVLENLDLITHKVQKIISISQINGIIYLEIRLINNLGDFYDPSLEFHNPFLDTFQLRKFSTYCEIISEESQKFPVSNIMSKLMKIENDNSYIH